MTKRMSDFLLACENDDIKKVKLLVDLGADVEQTDEFRRTAMMYASKGGKAEIIQYLHDKKPGMIHAEYYMEKTAFLLACEHSNLETVKLLIDLGANFEKSDYCKRTGMMYALKGGKTEIIQYLHERNPRMIHAENFMEQTAFLQACKNAVRHQKALELLYELGSDINHTDRNGTTCLMMVLSDKYLTKIFHDDLKKIIAYLLSKSKNIIHATDSPKNSKIRIF